MRNRIAARKARAVMWAAVACLWAAGVAGNWVMGEDFEMLTDCAAVTATLAAAVAEAARWIVRERERELIRTVADLTRHEQPRRPPTNPFRVVR